MPNISTSIQPIPSVYSGGGRVSSPKLRNSLEQSRDFAGLEEDTSRYDLLLLVKRVGKAAGFSPRMIALLDYYMSFTRDIDWEEGASPIVYQSLSRTALDFGVSERQIQRLEQSLFDAGAITWHDSGNHRRFGQRCPKSGRILYAYGIDLTPLAYLKSTLVEKLEEKRAYDSAWMETKRQISAHRGHMRGIIGELAGVGSADVVQWQAAYDDLAKPIRTHMSLETLRSLLKEHKELHRTMIDQVSPLTQKRSSKDDKNVAHYKATTQKQSNQLDTSRDKPNGFRERRNENSDAQIQTTERREVSQTKEDGARTTKDVITDTGLQHIPLKQALNAASGRFRERMPLSSNPMSWPDLVEAAYQLRAELHISQNSWAKACMTLGRTGAAICVLLTDQATLREDDPVRKPAGYFNAMVNRAEKGELHLHKSIFGILKDNAL